MEKKKELQLEMLKPEEEPDGAEKTSKATLRKECNKNLWRM